MANYEMCCRFCLKETSEFAVNIFNGQVGSCLAEKLNVYLCLTITDSPKWPRFACLDCVDFLLEMINFWAKIGSTVSTLNRDLVSGTPRQTIPNYDRNCRFCLKEISEFAVNIFKDENDRCLVDNLKVYLSLDLTDRSQWPRFACFDCVEFLMEMIKFRKKIRATFSTLNRKLGMAERHSQPQPVNQEPVKCEVKEPKSAVDHESYCSVDRPPSEYEWEQFTEVIEMVEYNVDEPRTKRLKGAAEDNPISDHEADCFPVDEEIFISMEDLSQYPVIEEPIQTSDFGELPEIILDEDFTIVEETEDSHKLAQEIIEPVVQDERANSTKKGQQHVHTESVIRSYSTYKLTEEEKELESYAIDMKWFECRLCGEDTQTLQGLLKHVKGEHADAERYDICCDVLLKSVPVPLDLYDHIRLHLDSDAFKCKECDFRGKTRLGLVTHIHRYHNSKTPNWVCDVCGAGYHSQSVLKKHYKNHTRANSHICKYCKKGFTEKAGLRYHIYKYHEKVVNFLCDLCGKGFPTSHRLIGHIKDHGGPHGGRRKKKTKPPTISNLPYNEEYFDSK